MMKNKILMIMLALCSIITGQAYAQNCLPNVVKVYDENGSIVEIDPRILQQNSPYEGYIQINEQTGFARIQPKS